MSDRRLFWPALLVAAAVALVGCGGGGTTSEVATASSETSPPAAAVEPPAVSEPPVEEPADSGIAQVGPDQWFVYEDGLEVQVTALESFQLGDVAYNGNPGDPGVIVTVTIKNGTSAVFDTALADVLLTHGPNGDGAEREYDFDGFTGSIPPGKSATAKYDFSVVPEAHFGEILVEVSPSWDHAASFFEGAAT